MHIAVVGLSHNTAPVEIREKLSIAEQTMEDSLQRLRADDQVLEASILSTCNRLEIYTLLRHPDLGVAAVGAARRNQRLVRAIGVRAVCARRRAVVTRRRLPPPALFCAQRGQERLGRFGWRLLRRPLAHSL